MWLLNLQWDDQLPPENHSEWEKFSNELQCINNIKVSRCILPFSEVEAIELHGFSDSSEAAFGAVVYCKSRTPAGEVVVKMVAKTSQLKIFVANRVATLQDLSCQEQWRHVSSGDNPADLISRGVNPSKMLESHLWWEGPAFLKTFNALDSSGDICNFAIIAADIQLSSNAHVWHLNSRSHLAIRHMFIFWIGLVLQVS
ncbi:hypothetical protein HNY73_011150 [Argiope bruennichi]|uniref:Uncharacterized protein n=1 Tax=Argiope bruennichi TaxID=94029 RepID=A0A8T0F5U0_ARGBR|nr:hypothetical protein HNY73_011150 [Argiope bruennichi]